MHRRRLDVTRLLQALSGEPPRPETSAVTDGVAALFEAVYDRALHAAGILDLEGVLLHANQFAKRSIGREISRSIGQPLWKAPWWLPDNETRLRDAVSRASRGEVVQFETDVGGSPGRRRRVDLSLRPAWGPSGRVFCLIAEARDITERRLAETPLAEPRRILRTVLDAIPVRVFWKDLDGRYLGCNRPFANDAGLGVPEDLLGRNDFELGWKQQAEMYRADDERVIRSGVPKLGYEEPQTSPSGRQLCLRTSKVPLRDDEGRIVGVLGMYEDITESKQAELALRESMERLQNVLTNLPIALISFDRNGIFTLSAGKGLAGITRTPGSIVGTSLFDFFRDQPVHLANMRRALAGEAFTVPVSIGDRVFEAHHSPLTDEQGIYRGTIVVMIDITESTRAEEERRRLEAQLLQAQKMESVGRLAGGVAHDFNNVLMVILGFAELIKRRRAGDQALVDELAEIERAATRARDVTRQLLAFSRQQIAAPRALNLSEMLADTQRALGRLIGEDVELRFHLARDLWLVKMDPAQVDQILFNLTANARDAMPNGGRLTVETQNARIDAAYCRRHAGLHPGDYVLLSVSDNGVGIDPQILSHIFEPFYTTKSAGQGTGLGLATVYGVVTQNGGVVNVYSEAGLGSTFKIYLPRLVGETAPPASVEAVPVVSRTGQVVLVEDNDTVRRLTAEMLHALGFVVLPAAGWRGALEMAARPDVAIDLLLTDVVMPELSGRELAARMRVLRPGLRVLYMSGYPVNVIAHRGILEDGVRFIEKPFTLGDLARAVDDTLRADPPGEPAPGVRSES